MMVDRVRSAEIQGLREALAQTRDLWGRTRRQRNDYINRLARARRWIETCVDPVEVGAQRKQAMLDYLDGKIHAPDLDSMPRAQSIGDTCCGECPGDTCYVDQVTGA